MQLKTALTSMLMGALYFGAVSSASIADRNNTSDALNKSGQPATPDICEQKDLWSLIRSWLLDDRSNCTNSGESNPDAEGEPLIPAPNTRPPIGPPRIPSIDSAPPLAPTGPRMPPPSPAGPRDPLRAQFIDPAILFPTPRDTFTPFGGATDTEGEPLIHPPADQPEQKGSLKKRSVEWDPEFSDPYLYDINTYNRAKRRADAVLVDRRNLRSTNDWSMDENDSPIPWAPADEPEDDQTESDGTAANPESADLEDTQERDSSNDLMDTADYGALDPALDKAMINRRAVFVYGNRGGSIYGLRRGYRFGKRRRRRSRDVNDVTEAQSTDGGDDSAVDEADDSPDSISTDSTDDAIDVSTETEYDNAEDNLDPKSVTSGADNGDSVYGSEGSYYRERSDTSDVAPDSADAKDCDLADSDGNASASVEQIDDTDGDPTSDDTGENGVDQCNPPAETEYHNVAESNREQSSMSKRSVTIYTDDRYGLDYIRKRDTGVDQSDTSDSNAADTVDDSSASTEQTEDADANPAIDVTSGKVNDSQVSSSDSPANIQYDNDQGSITKRSVRIISSDGLYRQIRDADDMVIESADTSDCDQEGSCDSSEQIDDLALDAANEDALGNPVITSPNSLVEPPYDEVDGSDSGPMEVQKRDTIYWGSGASALGRRRRALEDGLYSELEGAWIEPDSSEDSSAFSEETSLPDSMAVMDETGDVSDGGEGADVSDGMNDFDEDSVSPPAGEKKRDIWTWSYRRRRQTMYQQPLDPMVTFGPDAVAPWTPYDNRLYGSMEPSDDYDVLETAPPEL